MFALTHWQFSHSIAHVTNRAPIKLGLKEGEAKKKKKENVQMSEENFDW